MSSPTHSIGRTHALPFTAGGRFQDSMYRSTCISLVTLEQVYGILTRDVRARVPLRVSIDQAEIAARHARLHTLLAAPWKRRCRSHGHVVRLQGPKDLRSDGAVDEVERPVIHGARATSEPVGTTRKSEGVQYKEGVGVGASTSTFNLSRSHQDSQKDSTDVIRRRTAVACECSAFASI